MEQYAVSGAALCRVMVGNARVLHPMRKRSEGSTQRHLALSADYAPAVHSRVHTPVGWPEDATLCTR